MIKRKSRQWWPTISTILTKGTSTSNLNSQNTKKKKKKIKQGWKSRSWFETGETMWWGLMFALFFHQPVILWTGGHVGWEWIKEIFYLAPIQSSGYLVQIGQEVFSTRTFCFNISSHQKLLCFIMTYMCQTEIKCDFVHISAN